ncbi:uncharacterized protein LOC134213976 [Armigeres subalbatus]|uniref:uncharacterized protein LOC134213976 n=1 Tax=Armigeres subalbatus TaxID=124917 RepID=UPI002ED09142
MTTKSDRKRYTVKLRQYGSNEYDNFIDSLEDYAAFSEYADYADNYNIRGIQKPYKKPMKNYQPVYIRPKPAPIIRKMHHLPVNQRIVSVRYSFSDLLKNFLLTLITLGIPVAAFPFLVLAVKVLCGVKLLVIANVIVFGLLAAKYKYHHHNWSPSSGSSLLAITQPITTVVNTPVQQQQQQNWGYTYPWWPFYNSSCIFCYPYYNNSDQNDDTELTANSKHTRSNVNLINLLRHEKNVNES